MKHGSARLDPLDLALLAALATVLAVAASHHELVLDEAHAWNLARVAARPWDVLRLGALEGHTPLWYLVLWPLTLGGDPRWMQGLAVVLTAASAALLLRERPGPRWVCVLVLFGFYVIFRYSVIPRTYTLTLLFSAFLAARLHAGERRLVPLAIACGLIAMTGAFGVLLSAPLMLVVLERCTGAARRWSRRALLALVPGLAVYTALAVLASGFVIWPIADTSYVATIIDGVPRRHGPFDPLVLAVFPYWSSLPFGIGEHLSNAPAGRPVLAAGASLAALAFLHSLRGWRCGQFAGLAVIVLVVTGGWFSGLAEERFSGHIVLAALVLAWARPSVDTEVEARFRAPSRRFDLSGTVVLAVLLYQAAVGLALVMVDIRGNVSDSRDIARVIDAAFEQPYAIITARAFDLAGVTAYLDRDVFDVDCNCETRLNGVGQFDRPTDPVDVEQAWCALVARGAGVVGVFPDGRFEPDERHEVLARYPHSERFTGETTVFRLKRPVEACAFETHTGALSPQ